MLSKIKEMLGSEADSLLSYKAKFPKDQLNLPGPDFVDRVFVRTDRNISVLKNLQWIFQTGRVAGTGYVSILPVDQGIEHSAGASFAPNPVYFDPENIVKHNALIEYIEQLNAKGKKALGSIIIPHKGSWRYCINRIENDKDLTGWDFFNPANINTN